ncbi:D-amino acid dehydrogenase [Pigmentiphaga litoralis]|uniref:D-amino acid dehydrogenase n=1 Tax=Pigmentiphaga litoralis TaxID=516702 RepID=UPI003B42B13E
MHVIVVGAGIVGVCTAYFLSQEGMRVTVIDRRSGVAQEASFGNAGFVAPGYTSPWAAPALRAGLLTGLFKPEAPVLLRPSLDPAVWRWVRQWLGQCRADRSMANHEIMQRLARYSGDQLRGLRTAHALEYEQRTGLLQLLRSDHDVAASLHTRRVLEATGVVHTVLSRDDTAQLEPSLARAIEIGTPLAGAIHFPNDESGNCPLFARQLSNLAEAAGATFLFNATVRQLTAQAGAVQGVRLTDGRTLSADAVVMCAGADSARLMRPMGVRLPVLGVKTYSANVALRPDTIGPRQTVMDEAYKTSITPFGQRLRIAGTAEIGSRDATLRNKALRTLSRVGMDWLPGRLDMSRTAWWSGVRPMTPDGPPVLGPTGMPRLFINSGHGSHGWTFAAGAGRVVADLVAGKAPAIDLTGLDIGRYTRKN